MKVFGECPDLMVRCGTQCFHVHRCVMILASPVWQAMLTGEFKEAIESEVSVEDDAAAALGLCIELIYAGIEGNGKILLEINDEELDSASVVAEKYMMRGVTNLLAPLRKILELRDKIKYVQQSAEEAASRYADGIYESARQRKLNIGQPRTQDMQPGMVVNQRKHHPSVGTWVRDNYSRGTHTKREGVIISNHDDGGTEIGVRWDDGHVSRNLKCGKKDWWQLKYA